jgi:hypothetical protein
LASWGGCPSNDPFDLTLPPLLRPAVNTRLSVGDALESWISTSDTGYVHFRFSLSLAPKSSEGLGATETHTTKSFKSNKRRFFAFVIMPL